MTTPEETRERIKKMRDRIFKESEETSLEKKFKETPEESDKELDQNPIDNNVDETLQEPDLDAEKPKVAQNFKISSKSTKPTNLQAKLQQNDDRISLLSSDTKKQISEIALEFASKSSVLETEMLDKLEHTFAESNSKIDEIEQLVNDNSTSLSHVNTALKNELSELNSSLQLDINSVTTTFSSANQKIETNLQNNVDKLSDFENSVEERQTSLEERFYDRLQKNSDKLLEFSTDTQKKISEITLEFTSKINVLETEMLDNLEHTFAQNNSKIDGIEQLISDNTIGLSQANKALKERLDELNRSLQLDINSFTKRLSSTNQKIETELQNNAQKFKPIVGLSFTQQNIFDMLNNFLRNQLIKAASVTNFSSTRVKNGMFEKILMQN